MRHDSYGEGKVLKDVEKKITFDNNYIFRKEVEILKPDAIVFVTGPNYDYILENTFLGLKKVHVNEEDDEREICFFKHRDLPEKSIRVYHPSYIYRQGEEYIKLLLEQLKELIETK